MLEAELICDEPGLEAIQAEWDALAIACELPLMAPAWVLAWWRHVAPEGTQARVVAARDRGRLVGIAPFFVEPAARHARIDYRLPGIELSARLAPMAERNREWDVAEAIGRVLAAAQPRPDVVGLEGTPLTAQWGEALRVGWPGPLAPALHRYHVQVCPIVSLDVDGYEAWIARKSAHARERLRKARRKFEKLDGSVRIATPQTLRDDVATLLRLHAAHWEGRGFSNLLGQRDSVQAMFTEAGASLIADERFRLSVLEIDGDVVCAYLAMAAGGELLALNGGWNERWAKLSPTTLVALYQIEDAIARGQSRFDLGLGEQSYKLRLADGRDPVAWSVLLPARPRRLLTRARIAPMMIRPVVIDAAKRMLTPRQTDRARELRGRVQGAIRSS